jgi:hypothetical protein
MAATHTAHVWRMMIRSQPRGGFPFSDLSFVNTDDNYVISRIVPFFLGWLMPQLSSHA